MVGHDVSRRDEERHIRASFAGQIGVDLPKARASACAPNGLIHVARAAVVGGQHQVPVAKRGIHLLEVLASRVCGGDRVEALIDQTVDLETEQLAGGQHELPNARGTSARIGSGVEIAFDDGEVLQFQREIVLVEHLLEKWEIEISHRHDITHQLAASVCINTDTVANDRVIVHRYNGGHAREPVAVYIVRYRGVLVVVDTVGVRLREILGVPALEECAHILIEHFGDKSDVLIGRIGGENRIIFTDYLRVMVVIVLRKKG